MRIKEKKKKTCAAIILNYNHGQYISNTLDCICNQAIPFDEILVIDDCSSDNSIDIINEFSLKHKNFSFIKNKENLGVIKNLNNATNLINSDYIYYVSSDDYYSKNITTIFKNSITKYPNIAMISGNVNRKEINSDKISKLRLPFSSKISVVCPNLYRKTAKKMAVTFFGGGNIIRKDLILGQGLFEDKLKWYADWYLYQMIGFNEKVSITRNIFMTHVICKNSYSSNSFNWNEQKEILFNFFKLIKKAGLPTFDNFKDGAILPFYDIRILLIIIKEDKYREFFTPLLLWRLITYNFFKKFNKFIPTNYKNFIRTILKV